MRSSFFAAALVALLPLTAAAQDRGPVTNLPMPRFVSMKTNEGYVRRGPSRTHRIDWIFKHPGIPLEITAEYGHWRRVRDRDGMGGWMHYSLLSGARTVLVETDLLELRNAPMPDAPVVAQLELGVVARIRECASDWCELAVQGHRGYAPKSGLWGVRADEIID